MNMRRNQQDIPRSPQNTNLAGGRGHGCRPRLGRRTFIDYLVSMDHSSTGARNQGPSSIRRSHVSPRMEASLSMVEKTIGATTQYSVTMDEILGDRGSFVGLGGPEEFYQIDRKEVTKEEC